MYDYREGIKYSVNTTVRSTKMIFFKVVYINVKIMVGKYSSFFVYIMCCVNYSSKDADREKNFHQELETSINLYF